MRFENKVGIVTGSGGGIGQAYAEALHTADRAVQQAVIESGKLPGRISKLAATPAEAFARWADGRRRGYLRG